MIKLDDNLLTELGLGALPKEEKASFLKHMYETLEMRVGTELAKQMSEQQMTEFEQFINSGDEQGAFQWLETNFPNYKDVVAQEFDRLKGEIAPLAPQIMAASQQPDVQAPQAPPVQPQPASGYDPYGPAQPHNPAPAAHDPYAQPQPAPQAPPADYGYQQPAHPTHQPHHAQHPTPHDAAAQGGHPGHSSAQYQHPSYGPAPAAPQPPHYPDDSQPGQYPPQQ